MDFSIHVYVYTWILKRINPQIETLGFYFVWVCVCKSLSLSLSLYIYIYIYIYRERERENLSIKTFGDRYYITSALLIFLPLKKKKKMNRINQGWILKKKKIIYKSTNAYIPKYTELK